MAVIVTGVRPAAVTVSVLVPGVPPSVHVPTGVAPPPEAFATPATVPPPVTDTVTGTFAIAFPFSSSTVNVGVGVTAALTFPVIVPVTEQFGLPVKFVGLGEGADDLEPFDAGAFAQGLFSE